MLVGGGVLEDELEDDELETVEVGPVEVEPTPETLTVQEPVPAAVAQSSAPPLA